MRRARGARATGDILCHADDNICGGSALVLQLMGKIEALLARSVREALASEAIEGWLQDFDPSEIGK
jgi:hypothetical protein